MRRRLCLLLALVALALGARPPSAAACSILPVPPDQQARAVQDTIAGADLIARGTVVGTRPIAVDGRYYQQLTLNVITSWRGAPATRVTVVGPTLSADTGLASTIGVFTGTAPTPPCGASPPAVGDDLLVFARDDDKGHLRLSAAASPNDALATTLRAQLGAGSAPPPASPTFAAFLPLLIGAVAVVAGVTLAGVRRRTAPRLRRG
jgi:hypothetical protein